MSILDNELKNRHYENVIIMGLQLSNVMFNTNQNANRIRIGKKVEEAILSCDRELGEIIIDGKELSKDFISVKLNIDDLGWSLYQLDKKKWAEAVEVILKGVYSAEKMAIDLNAINDSMSSDFLNMALKGYRHLVGIFLDSDIKKIKDGILIEKIIKTIISSGNILRNHNLTDFLSDATIVEHDDLTLKTYLLNGIDDDLYLKDFIDNEFLSRMKNIIKIYNKIEIQVKSKAVSDLYYSFSRNNVKLIKSEPDPQAKSNLIQEAKIFADLYKGSEKNHKSKRWIRYRSLINELNFANVNKNNISNLIHEITDTIMQCTTRTDLLYRNSTLLVHTLAKQFELSVKSNSTLTVGQKKEKIQLSLTKINKIKEDLKRVDVIIDSDFLQSHKSAKSYFKKEMNSL
ncbi:MAG: hypothetical protein HOP11_11740 [Saprospiraceae bacterium]|nr:hypothetical protein [Saprospiraceae bacterium]